MPVAGKGGAEAERGGGRERRPEVGGGQDLIAVAQAMGLQAQRAANREDLFRALAQPSGGPRLIDVQLRSDETLMPKVTAMPQADGSMLSMPLEDMTPLLPLAELQQQMMIPLAYQSLAARGKA